MEIKEEKPIEEVLDEYNISWSYGDKDKTLKTLDMFKESIEDDWVNNCYNKIWVVTYCDIVYGERQPTVTCFNNRENAMKYYEYVYDKYNNKYNIVSIDECEVYTWFKIK